MARIVVTPASIEDLELLIRTHSLPADTKARVRHSLAPLAQFPLLGAELDGRWSGFRFLLGPWRWLILVYLYDASADRIAVVTMQDARAVAPPVSGRF